MWVSLLMSWTWGLCLQFRLGLRDAAVCRKTSQRCPRFAWPYLLVLFLVCRVGEAANPGPSSSSFVLGAFNPSGLKGKAPFIVSHLAQGDIWAVSETHLCSQSMAAFRSSMHFAQGPFRFCVGGHPVPASSDRAFHAAWRGV